MIALEICASLSMKMKIRNVLLLLISENKDKLLLCRTGNVINVQDVD